MNYDLWFQLVNVGEDVLLFYNDKASFQILVDLMRSERHRMDPHSPLRYVQPNPVFKKPASRCQTCSDVLIGV